MEQYFYHNSPAYNLFWNVMVFQSLKLMSLFSTANDQKHR